MNFISIRRNKAFLPLMFIICLCNIKIYGQKSYIPQPSEIPYIGRSNKKNYNVNHPKAVDFQNEKKGVCILAYLSPSNSKTSFATGMLVNSIENSFDGNKKIYLLTAAHVKLPTGKHLIDEDGNPYNIANHVKNFTYISFDFEVADPNKNYTKLDEALVNSAAFQNSYPHYLENTLNNSIEHFDSDEKTKIRSFWKVKIKSRLQDFDSDIALYEIVPEGWQIENSEIMQYVYTLGWDVHRRNIDESLEGAKANVTLIGHPQADLKKISFSDLKLSYFENGMFEPLSRTSQTGLFRTYNRIYQRLSDANFTGERGASGSPMLLFNKKVNSVYISSEPETPSYLATLLENSWYLLSKRIILDSEDQDLMTVLDPQQTWISSVNGGYLNELIENPPYSQDFFDLTVSASNRIVSAIDLQASDFFYFLNTNISENDHRLLREKTLGDGILLKPNTSLLNNQEIRLMLRSDDDIIYEKNYTNSTSTIFKVFNGQNNSNIKNNILNLMRNNGFENVDELQILSEFEINDMELSIETNQGEAKVRAIKLPLQMPYNAREIFEVDPYKDLWQSFKYKESRAKDSKNLHIKEIVVELEQYLPSSNGGQCIKLNNKILQRIETGDNGGYLNLVNPNYLIDNIVASEDNCPANNLKITIYTYNLANKYYGVWLDYWKHRKGLINNNVNHEDSYTYNFVDDVQPHIEEKIELVQNNKIYFTIKTPIVRASDLEFNSKNEYQTRLRVAVAKNPQAGSENLTQDGIYEEGEVEDYLVRIRKSNCDDKKQYAKESKNRKVSVDDAINTGVSDCTITPFASPTTPTISGGQVCHELSGECVDTNTCGNINLTLGNETAWNFNNTDSYIDLNTDELLVGNTTSNLDALTVSFYAYAAQALAPGNTQYLFSLGDNNNGLSIRQNGANIQLGFATTNTSTGSMVLEAPLPMNQWVNITAVYDGENNPNIASDGVLKLYINNAQVAATNAPSELLFANQNQVETTFADAANSTLLQNTFLSAPSSNADIVSFDGALANLSIYSEALSAAEIAYFNCETNLPTPSFAISQRGLAPAKTDIKTELNLLDFSIFPNPAKDHLNILVEVQRAGPLDLGIYDQAGRQVYELKKEKIPQGHQIITINQLNLATGIYIVKVRAGNVFRSEKVVVE